MTTQDGKSFYEENLNPGNLEVFKSPTGESFITIEGITYPVLGTEFMKALYRKHYLEFGCPPNKTRLKKAIEEIDMFAQLFGDTMPVFHRFAKLDGTQYIDLGTPDFKAIEITPKNVRIITNPPTKFIRSAIQQEIKIPSPKAVARDLRRLRKYVPFKTDADFILFAAWLLSCMNTDGGYPPLFLVGEQGSAKSTTTAFIKNLLDACTVPLRNLPKSMKELMIAASNDFILCFDNISNITNSQSDNVCKISTGAGFATRKLYTTMEEIQRAFKRPVLINTIGFVPTRQDLLDRSIIVHLDFIKAEDRKTIQELMASWEEDRPFIFGALCNAVSAALRNFDSVPTDNLPRMADFAKWVIAAEEQLPWDKGGFMEAFQNSRSILVDDAIDADPVAMTVLKLMAARQEWKGTGSELLDLLGELAGQLNTGNTGWPRVPNHLSQKLNRVSAFLREKGVLFQKSHSGPRSITLSKIAPKEAKTARKGTYATDPQGRMEAVQKLIPAGSPMPSTAPKPEVSEDSSEIQASTTAEADF